NPCPPSQYHNLQTSPSLSISISQPSSFSPQDDMSSVGYFQTSGTRSNGAPTLESPRIEITAYGQRTASLDINSAKRRRPASSVSSRSCHSEASSYESGFSYNYDNSPQNSPWQFLLSAVVHPRCFSSPFSIRFTPYQYHRRQLDGNPRLPTKFSFFNGAPSHKYHPYSPNQSPGPVTEDTWLPNTNQYTNSAIVAAINALTTDGLTDLGEGIPLNASMNLKVEPGGEDTGSLELCQEDFSSARLPFKKETYCSGFLDVPQHPYWSKPKPYISPSLPALDWQLPSSSGPYSLQIDVQPKSHHRAHYETEGSRGAVKALAGGHPVVQ
ncbi:hypothetical protein M9458_038401, partial [Cirrhinus mrigala]